MENLYTFSKRSWHVRLFKWLFNSDPTETYKTMCPYFWTYVLVFLFFPLVIFIRLLGKGGKKFLDNLRTSKQRREQRLLTELKARFYKALEEGQAAVYKLSRTRCWKNFANDLYYKVEYSDMRKFQNLRETEYHRIWQEKRDQKYARAEAAEVRNQKIDDIKDSLIGKIIGYSLLVILIGALCYGIFILGRWIVSVCLPPNWKIIGIAVGILASLLFIIWIVFIIFKYAIIPFCQWVYCHLKKITLPRLPIGRYIAWPFIMIWKFFVLIVKCIAIACDMLYNAYKKRCPRITWEE